MRATPVVMILTKELLSKTGKKGRLQAVTLLNKLAAVGKLPEPYYEYRPGGYAKKRLHYFKVRFRVPQFLMEQMQDMFDTSVVGAGRCRQKPFSKTLAALEVVHQLEEGLGVARGGLQAKLDDYLAQEAKKQQELEKIPVDTSVPNVTWFNLPMDPAFPESQPATRRGRIDFFPRLKNDAMAFMAAKASTLTAETKLPSLVHQANQAEDGITQKWANLKVAGRIKGWANAMGPDVMGMDAQDAEYICFSSMAESIVKKSQQVELEDIISAALGPSSFGMAKLFVAWPKHHYEPVKELLTKLEEKRALLPRTSDDDENARPGRWDKPHGGTGGAGLSADRDKALLKPRLDSFRRHQRLTPLPIDSVEANIPHDAEVVVVRGGTGSGKTTRYPLMLSLTSPHPNTRVVVAQPRRLACQTASRRVAAEQDSEIGHRECPIGYAVRFESFLAKAGSRTVDFMTPGVLLRIATNDPLLGDITHLCIDEVHERNADIDLLQALAKQAQEQRLNHPTLPPLQITLMSATLDSDQWVTYFGDRQVKVVDVPDIRRFPINVVHIDDQGFPSAHLTEFLERKKPHVDYDDAICKAMADLAFQAYENELSSSEDGGSVLCFLPGMDEIRLVDYMIKKRSPRIATCHLHSSVSSKDQARAFLPGKKIILSTNIAETSVTIPDVKVVIDSGRERQFSLLESTLESATVVGSQLLTVAISQASAKQRAGRAGRVSAGTCYRLYSRRDHDAMEPYTIPEMLRMDLSQLVLHSLSLFRPAFGHPLSLIRMAPDPPPDSKLYQTLTGLSSKGLVVGDGPALRLTPLGHAVGNVPASPQLSRMVFLGLAMRALDPALTIAAILSVPKAVSYHVRSNNEDETNDHNAPCSDLVIHIQAYNEYTQLPADHKSRHPRRTTYDQVTRVRRQLADSMDKYVREHPNENWNLNSERLGAQASLICAASPYIAHLTSGRSFFATRDVAGDAILHPSSVNFNNTMRVHWYTYFELRTTKSPYLHVTTAASPLELALYSDCGFSPADKEAIQKRMNSPVLAAEWLFIADQWVPVALAQTSQRHMIWGLKRWLTYDLLQDVVQEPGKVAADEDVQKLMLYVISAIEQQRMKL